MLVDTMCLAIYIHSHVLQHQGKHNGLCVHWFISISRYYWQNHLLNMEETFFIIIFFSSERVPHLCERQTVCVCVCVKNSWENGASWKSSAAVSLLLAARVHVSEGGETRRERGESVSK